VSPSRQAALPVDAIARGAPGHALVVGADKDVETVRLTPAHARAPWRELVREPPGRDLGLGLGR
jgi:hypothetical protein